jgi:hypothetical protein
MGGFTSGVVAPSVSVLRSLETLRAAGFSHNTSSVFSTARGARNVILCKKTNWIWNTKS